MTQKRPFTILAEQVVTMESNNVQEVLSHAVDRFCDWDVALKVRIYDIDNDIWHEHNFTPSMHVSEIVDDVIEEMKHAQNISENRE